MIKSQYTFSVLAIDQAHPQQRVTIGLAFDYLLRQFKECTLYQQIKHLHILGAVVKFEKISYRLSWLRLINENREKIYLKRRET